MSYVIDLKVFIQLFFFEVIRILCNQDTEVHLIYKICLSSVIYINQFIF